ncbi:MAG: AAA family ATPase [bacterium]|nr:AAA family ATPase [bacterium]
MFDQIKGQEKAVQTIVDLIGNKRFPHSLLFYGPEGTGKFTLAKLISRYFCCPNPDEGSRGRDLCPVCVKIDKEIYHDLVIEKKETYVSREGEEKEAKEIKVDQIRSIIKKINYKSVEGPYKFFIIDGAEMMNNISENTFLKTLEEPLPNNYIILIAHNINNILPTILSRCVKIKFDPLPGEVLTRLLKEKHGLDDVAASRITLVSHGSLRRAQLLLTDNMYATILGTLEEFIGFLVRETIDIPLLYGKVEEITSMENDHIEILLEFLLLYISESWKVSGQFPPAGLVFKKHLNLKNISIKSYSYMVDEIIRIRHYLSDSNINLRLLIENLVLSLKERLIKG